MSQRKKKYKDMQKMRIARNAERQRYYDKTANKYKRRKWTPEELKLLFNNNLTDTELSELIERSVRSIQVKRCRINADLKLKTA